MNLNRRRARDIAWHLDREIAEGVEVLRGRLTLGDVLPNEDELAEVCRWVGACCRSAVDDSNGDTDLCQS